MITIPPPLPFEYYKIAEDILASFRFVPYCHEGRSVQTGFDCGGHIFAFHQRIGLPIVWPTNAVRYPRDFWKSGMPHIFMNWLREQFEFVPERCVQFGDICVFEFRPNTGKVSHGGIMMGSDQFQHVIRNRSVDNASLHERFWRSRLLGFMRYKRMGVLHEKAKQIGIESRQ